MRRGRRRGGEHILHLCPHLGHEEKLHPTSAGKGCLNDKGGRSPLEKVTPLVPQNKKIQKNIR